MMYLSKNWNVASLYNSAVVGAFINNEFPSSPVLAFRKCSSAFH